MHDEIKARRLARLIVHNTATITGSAQRKIDQQPLRLRHDNSATFVQIVMGSLIVLGSFFAVCVLVYSFFAPEVTLK